MKYQVIVGNVGTVYDGNCWMDAWKDYHAYVRASKYDACRASDEPVYLFRDGHIIKEHQPESSYLSD